MGAVAAAQVNQTRDEISDEVVPRARKVVTMTTFCEEKLRQQPTLDLVRNSRAALLVLHSPLDITVDVTNAAEIWPLAAGEARTIRAGTVLRGAL